MATLNADIKQKKKRPVRSLHIYLFSRLFRQSATRWLSTIKRVEADEDYLVKQYFPLRSALNREVGRPGSGEKNLSDMLAERSDTSTNRTITANSNAYLEGFRAFLLPQIERVIEDYVNGPSKTRTFMLGGVLCAGQLHAKVRLKDGATKLLYYHPSDWKDTEIEAFLELLTILAEEAYGLTRNDIWFVDLARQEIIKPRVNYINVRKELTNTAQLWERFIR